MSDRIDFQTDPSRYRHWRTEVEGPVATVWMDVDEDAGLFEGYQLKLNSYDLGVDIELNDIVQRMRFEHPEVRAVVLRSAKDKVFCAGANIRMLGGAKHSHKVGFCKFTNETRNAYEAAEAESGQTWIAAIQGACAGGGYELALACNHLMLVDDRTSSVSLPEVPLLAVLPGTGGLTRVTDKRHVRRDRADVFCSTEEGIKGARAVEWGLVDEAVGNNRFDETVAERAAEIAGRAPREAEGVEMTPLDRTFTPDGVEYSTVSVKVLRDAGRVEITVRGPEGDAPADAAALHAEGAAAWLMRCAREVEDAILHLRMNEMECGLWVLRTEGDAAKVAAHEAVMLGSDHWFAVELRHYWKRVLKRLDVTSRSIIALVENGGAWAGMLAEMIWAADRAYMMEGAFEDDDRPEAAILPTEGNLGAYPMGNDLTRLRTRFWGDDDAVAAAEASAGEALDAERADELGLVTMILDDIDWEDEVRIVLEERASFSPDAMTGMEANLRFAGPETMETRIFGRLTAWQNWIFNRPNAVGKDGALQRYGSGVKGDFDMERV
ncbi:2,3-epoxybenzoyl-CoA dihydrolase [Jannaschia sp. Os4]|uniref:2,3-epoxybenzoyl-CoA dihydrolase n=1 Tax=Jannaschia sp. Os4 TaxID=2807617 RepID=UPI00193A819B|nr:2,3-epoxybenzoyl-CoA dihydrolase [Jannaschia sp. Os4]MBM2575959.1 2,3-epoxybenzoyl-CoA dihydrolase [Jannaschia sp. Os4]